MNIDMHQVTYSRESENINQMVVKGAAAAGPVAKMKPGMTVILPTERDGRIVPGY